jgi:hypothetical protein
MRSQQVLTFVSGFVLVALSAALLNPAYAAGQGDNNPDVIEIRHYKLTMDVAQKTAAAMQKINQLIATNPSMNGAIGATSDDTASKPLTQQAQNIDAKFPQIAAVIHANGLGTREFLVAVGAFINDVGWVSMKKGGAVKAYPPGMITPENAALVEANWDAFQALGAKMSPPETR